MIQIVIGEVKWYTELRIIIIFIKIILAPRSCIVLRSWFHGRGFTVVVSRSWFHGRGFNDLFSRSSWLQGRGFTVVVSRSWFHGHGFTVVVYGRDFTDLVSRSRSHGRFMLLYGGFAMVSRLFHDHLKKSFHDVFTAFYRQNNEMEAYKMDYYNSFFQFCY